ncbi:serine/threonine-protein kinase MRCK gamma [Protopterus annectens]|uniref:serine/threonine-protein kinase MRCK gamma n=1 Tax=Protopterus annectens TaxID=7888 RepID=UPI001CFC32B5|nr:serine/threonine-protein kinase MRCK gamma [Protopterus annectens]
MAFLNLNKNLVSSNSKTFKELDFECSVKPFVKKVKDLRLHRDDFEILKVIGRGAFGEVAVVKMKKSDKVYAMKILHKWEMLKRAETACFHEERDVLVKGDNQWITTLHYAFQDEQYLYLVMDYYVGGDLLTLLSKFEERLPEDMARFYLAEMVLAIHSIHQLNYVHRDIKPDNVLIDMNGHIRLADFGSCLKLREDRKVESSVAVGTPDYISPEILQAMEDGKGRYGTECDWWSLGVCMYELLFGETPFYAESLVETYGKIMNHQDHLQFPSDITDVSNVAKDLIRRLICSQEERLGQNGIEDFKNHPFFAGIDWENLRNNVPPHIPEVTSPADTSNFDVDDDSLRNSETLPPTSHSAFSGHHLPFVGFTYTSDCCLSDRSCLLNLSSGLHNSTHQSNKGDSSKDALETRCKRLEQEKQELARKLQEALQNSSHNSVTRGNTGKDSEIKSLKEEMEILKKKLKENQLEGSDMKIRKDEESSQVRSLEKQLKILYQEKEALYKELTEVQEQLNSQNKEYKEAVAMQKQALKEAGEANEKYQDMKSQKQKLSRHLRDREEEIAVMMQKIESLRQDCRKTERDKKELEAQIEELSNEALKQRKLRERSDQNSRELVEELEELKMKHLVQSPGIRSSEHLKEVSKLKTELEEKRSSFEEELARRNSVHAVEIKNFREELEESESQQQALHAEIASLKEKLQQIKYDSLCYQEGLTDLRNKFEREKHEKHQLNEENYKLNLRLDQEKEFMNKLIAANKQLEEDLFSLADKKESLANWEAQIADILQWVNDEKDSRVYLQALTNKMTEELETLKNFSGGMKPTVETQQWKTRRLQKMEASAKLELQSALDAEIKAKQMIHEELSKTKAANLTSERKLHDAEKQIEALKLEIEKLKDVVQSKTSGGINQWQSIKFIKPGENSSSSHVNSSLSLQEIRNSREDAEPHHGARTDGFEITYPPKQLLRRPVSPGSTSPTALKFAVCNYVCHTACYSNSICPVPADQMKRSLGVDPVSGKGTAYEGFLSVPKPAGVRKGWQKAYAVLSEYKLFLYDMGDGKNSQPGVTVSQVVDMRDEHFSVSSVLHSDVIHANPKDVPCIFKITASQLEAPHKCSLLLLAESENDMKRWVAVMRELHQILQVNHKDKSVYTLKEAYDSALPLIRPSLSAAIIDQERFALGTEDGLYVVHTKTNEISQVGDSKKVQQIEVIPDVQLIAILCGRNHSVRLHTWNDLETLESSGIKISEAKNCQTMVTGHIQQKTIACLGVAMKRQVILYHLTSNSKTQYKRIKEFQAAGNVQWMGFVSDRLCVGYQSGFCLYPVLNDSSPLSLINSEDQTLAFAPPMQMDALCAVEVSRNEYLLCFNKVGVYVNSQGRRSKQEELMWPTNPVACCYNDKHLTVFSENAVDVFNVKDAEWVQTVPLKKVRPLNTKGSLCVFGNEIVRLIYLANKLRGQDDFNVPKTMDNSRRQLMRTKSKRRFFFRISDEEKYQQMREILKDPGKKSKLISDPYNFSHVVHVGPGDGKHYRKDLPVVHSIQEEDSLADVTPMSRPRSATEKGRPASMGTDKVLDLAALRHSRSSLTDESLSSPQMLFSSGDMLSEITDHTTFRDSTGSSQGSS